MSETIIIEANREIAYKDEIKSLRNVFINETLPNFPNNEWVTQIQSGIPLEVGDQISIEATMIQQKGTPEETIEFSGESNIKNPFGYVDNKAEMEFNFYITNRQQFNCPLPLTGMEIYNAVADASTLNYGLPDISTFDNFKSAYPYRGIEGMFVETVTGPGGTTINYIEVQGGGVFTNAPQNLVGTNTTRLYLMNIDGIFKSYQTADGVLDLPQFASSKVDISVETGFNTPANVSQKITEQFHQRDGEPDFETGWTSAFSPTNSYRLDGTLLTAKQEPAITDKLYRSIATSTGDLLNGRLVGQWTASFTGETGGDGGNYVEQQGLNFLYKNILCGDPDHFVGSILTMSLRENNFNATNVPTDLTNAGTYTGDALITNGIGQWGCNVCLLDVLDFTEVNNQWEYPTSRTTKGTTATLKTLKMKAEELLVLNLPYGDKSVQQLGFAMERNRVAQDNFSPSSQETDESKYTNWTADMYFGRADDKNSLGANGYKSLLATPRVLKGYNVTNLPTSYPVINGVGTYVGFTLKARHTTRHDTRFHIYYKSSLNQTSPNKVNLTLPTNSEFSLTNSLGQYGDQLISQRFGFAVIPVFYKNPPTPSLQDVPFCAVISYDSFSWSGETGYEKINYVPYPIQGEFFGYSPSMYDNLLSKVVTTQKNDLSNIADFIIATEPYNYGAFVFIGADNPSLTYDDTSSRMSFKEFHTAVRPGNGAFQYPLDKANDQASIESMSVNEKCAFICATNPDNTQNPFAKVEQQAKPFPVISTQSGIALASISFTKAGDTLYTLAFDPLQPEGYTGTMFEKLGFVAEQLIPFSGFIQNQFNRSNYNSGLGNDIDYSYKYNNMVKPFTTNAYISGADQLSFVLNITGQNMENLGAISQFNGIYINAESDELIAVNLPQKLDYPYLVVYSDIVRNTKFFGGANGQQKIPAMGYISRNYSTGDYFYSFSTGWTYTIDTPYVLTDFKTQIMLPDGRPAPIEKNSSVVYKIIKRMTLPPPPLEIPKHNEKEIKQKTPPV